MHIHLDCPGCGRFLRVNEQFAGRTVRCPSCGRAYTAPSPHDVRPPRPRPPADAADELHAPCEGCGVLVHALADGVPVWCAACTAAPAVARGATAASQAVFAPPAALAPTGVTPAAELPAPAAAPEPARPAAPPGPSCPKCGGPMAADAVVCIACGYNRATGKRLKTASRRIARTFNAGGLSFPARLVGFLILVAACFVPALVMRDDPTTRGVCLLIPLGGAALGALALGVFRRVTVTTDAHGTPILIEQAWFCFIPGGQSTIDLTDFRTIRLTHRETSPGPGGCLVGGLLFLLGGLPALLWRMHQLRGGFFTLEIVPRQGVDGAPILEPLPVYHGRSEETARGVGDALEQIAGLRYG